MRNLVLTTLIALASFSALVGASWESKQAPHQTAASWESKTPPHVR